VEITLFFLFLLSFFCFILFFPFYKLFSKFLSHTDIQKCYPKSFFKIIFLLFKNLNFSGIRSFHDDGIFFF